ncbi:MAG TPA: hypothetical protein VEA16_04045 [Vicinamibacterales bacterium]|nr:hypothetical protein [Vicinamibacterales bacterium]
MTHLTPDELIDAVEGTLPALRDAHVRDCEACRREVAGLSGVFHEAKQIAVPEPSPLFWAHFSKRVNTAIDADAVIADDWRSWLRWQNLAPIGALTLILLALITAVPKQADTTIGEHAAASLEAPAAMDEPDALEMLVGSLDIETASAAGVIEPGLAERAVLQLTSEEQQELARLLRVELSRAKS